METAITVFLWLIISIVAIPVLIVWGFLCWLGIGLLLDGIDKWRKAKTRRLP